MSLFISPQIDPQTTEPMSLQSPPDQGRVCVPPGAGCPQLSPACFCAPPTEGSRLPPPGAGHSPTQGAFPRTGVSRPQHPVPYTTPRIAREDGGGAVALLACGNHVNMIYHRRQKKKQEATQKQTPFLHSDFQQGMYAVPLRVCKLRSWHCQRRKEKGN